MSRRPGALPHLYGYGIVDRTGEPYWSEDCVCQDRGPLDESVACLNDSYREEHIVRQPFRVVRLVYVGREKPR